MRAALGKEELKTIYDRAAQRYDRQHALLTARSDQRGRRLLVERTVAPGDRVLDCGAGTGTTGLLAAKRSGPAGRVTLLDASEGMLAVAARKAAARGLQERVELKVGDILALPFADGSFDVVLSTYSMCPIYDPVAAAREVFRVTRPGGLIGVAHSTEPGNRLVRSLAQLVEGIAWRFPSLSLGCRPVSVLPTLEQLGCRVEFRRQIGVPLWPFLVFVAKRPESLS